MIYPGACVMSKIYDATYHQWNAVTPSGKLPLMKSVVSLVYHMTANNIFDYLPEDFLDIQETCSGLDRHILSNECDNHKHRLKTKLFFCNVFTGNDGKSFFVLSGHLGWVFGSVTLSAVVEWKLKSEGVI